MEQVVCGSSVRKEAIHSKEFRVALIGLRRAAGLRACCGTRLVSIGDNMSEILATEKGRARNHELNAFCRQTAALDRR